MRRPTTTCPTAFFKQVCRIPLCGSAHKYISLQPKEANPYDTMGDIISNIYPDSAWFYYSESLARKSDFAVPLEKLERIALRKGRFEQADSLCARMLDSDDVVYRSKGRLYAAQTSMIRGQFQKALLELDAGIEADINDRATKPCRALKSALPRLCFAYKKEIDAALRELDTAETLPTVQGVGLRDLWRLETDSSSRGGRPRRRSRESHQLTERASYNAGSMELPGPGR
jgi:tetratricopeptide (TPR) repeat protein